MFSIYELLKENKEEEDLGFDLLREADDDADAGGGNEAGGDAAETEAPTNDAGGDDDGGDDDEFDIDSSLDEPTDGSAGGDDDGGGSDSGDTSMDSSSDSSSSGGSGDEEVNDNNTNIFNSLTAEEQQMKIRELKNQYRDLYTSTDDIIERLSNFFVYEKTYHVINRINDALHILRNYIADYFVYVFPTKSYIENDIKYNEFLYIISKMTSILDKFATDMEKESSKLLLKAMIDSI